MKDKSTEDLKWPHKLGESLLNPPILGLANYLMCTGATRLVPRYWVQENRAAGSQQANRFALKGGKLAYFPLPTENTCTLGRTEHAYLPGVTEGSAVSPNRLSSNVYGLPY